MADLGCRLECGCELRWSARYYDAGSAYCSREPGACVILSPSADGLSAGAILDVLRVGYAIAASRGVGPWAASFPRQIRRKKQ